MKDTGNVAVPEHADSNVQAKQPGLGQQFAIEPADTPIQQANTDLALDENLRVPQSTGHLTSETPTTAEGGPAVVPPATSPETLADQALANQGLETPDT
jgi:hypothetical protein